MNPSWGHLVETDQYDIATMPGGRWTGGKESRRRRSDCYRLHRPGM